MSRAFDRLRRGERWWAAELVMRSLGVLLLGGAHRASVWAHRIITTPPVHQTTPGELALCAMVFLLLTSGLAFVIEGPGLFRYVPIPSRSLWY
ncbi:hypothetical protein [Novosphingobium sp. MD-1]|uniref:hypothetical protein n=1 Tax=Novosphingobium sp. MD-1 TaxID=1630648 RepID=UPI00061BAA1D|nr:hypothetical protein [Novosphingobium sp. MD-1]GAO53576.1 hypothetical protein NMD1_00582 [Novosphingobium sp. MD-1]